MELMKTTASDTPSTQKVRREQLGSKRPEGWEWQRANRRVRRARASGLEVGRPDPRLSGLGGLASFNAFVQGIGLGRRLRRDFGHLKTGAQVVYPMAAQIQLLLDASVAGARRIFDFEVLATDPVFRHLAGGIVPSIDVLYDDLRRFRGRELERLEELMAEQGLEPLTKLRAKELTIDVDTTVTPLFGEQEGAHVGYNPRYHGRVSYHPILARIAETDTMLGARLRPGDTGIGEDDVEDIAQWIGRLHRAAPKAVVTMRIDSGGESAALLSAVERGGAYFVAKMRQTANLMSAVARTTRWRTTDRDAFGEPTRQVAVVDFRRDDWPPGWRVVAVRTSERDTGKQVHLWEDLDYSAQVYLTNDHDRDADDVARFYDGRAGIEPLFAELKNAFGIGYAPTNTFDANEAALLLKLLAYNLMRRWVLSLCPGTAVAHWRATWMRRACVLVPARLLRVGGRWQLRLAPRPMLN